MKKSLTLILIVVILTIFCGKSDDQNKEAADDPSQYQLVEDEQDHQHLHFSDDLVQKWGIQLSTPQTKDYFQKISLTGIVKENQNTSYQVTPRIAGYVISLSKDISDQVQRGQVLCTINSPHLLELKTNYIKAFHQYRLTKSDYQRAANLAKVNALETKEVMKREIAYKTAAADFFSLEAELISLDYDSKILNQVRTTSKTKNLEQLKKFLTPQHQIKAPAAGKIIGRHLTLGKQVGENDIIYELANTSKFWVILDAKEHDIRFLSIGKEVEVVADIYPQITFSGKIVAIFEKIDPEIRTHRIRVLVTNKMSYLKPEMFVSGKIKTDIKNQYYCLPESAVVKVSGINAIFIKETDGFSIKPIQIIAVDSARNVFIQGLTGEEMVVSKGAFYLKAEYEINKDGVDEHAGHQH